MSVCVLGACRDADRQLVAHADHAAIAKLRLDDRGTGSGKAPQQQIRHERSGSSAGCGRPILYRGALDVRWIDRARGKGQRFDFGDAELSRKRLAVADDDFIEREIAGIVHRVTTNYAAACFSRSLRRDEALHSGRGRVGVRSVIGNSRRNSAISVR